MTSDELRKAFLDFFKNKGHAVIPVIESEVATDAFNAPFFPIISFVEFITAPVKITFSLTVPVTISLFIGPSKK